MTRRARRTASGASPGAAGRRRRCACVPRRVRARPRSTQRASGAGCLRRRPASPVAGPQAPTAVTAVEPPPPPPRWSRAASMSTTGSTSAMRSGWAWVWAGDACCCSGGCGTTGITGWCCDAGGVVELARVVAGCCCGCDVTGSTKPPPPPARYSFTGLGAGKNGRPNRSPGCSATKALVTARKSSIAATGTPFSVHTVVVLPSSCAAASAGTMSALCETTTACATDGCRHSTRIRRTAMAASAATACSLSSVSHCTPARFIAALTLALCAASSGASRSTAVK
mmetsp:Transcript_22092/g.68580  ORF Transcript_22092/g.68580 Transcript_22092/m.68580 type:complete len:283 (+) Transcript_22092:689-1537(+)